MSKKIKKTKRRDFLKLSFFLISFSFLKLPFKKFKIKKRYKRYYLVFLSKLDYDL